MAVGTVNANARKIQSIECSLCCYLHNFTLAFVLATRSVSSSDASHEATEKYFQNENENSVYCERESTPHACIPLTAHYPNTSTTENGRSN